MHRKKKQELTLSSHLKSLEVLMLLAYFCVVIFAKILLKCLELRVDSPEGGEEGIKNGRSFC